MAGVEFMNGVMIDRAKIEDFHRHHELGTSHKKFLVLIDIGLVN